MIAQIGFTSRPVLPGNAPALSHRDLSNFFSAKHCYFLLETLCTLLTDVAFEELLVPLDVLQQVLF